MKVIAIGYFAVLMSVDWQFLSIRLIKNTQKTPKKELELGTKLKKQYFVDKN